MTKPQIYLEAVVATGATPLLQTQALLLAKGGPFVHQASGAQGLVVVVALDFNLTVSALTRTGMTAPVTREKD
jgi:hypothetical protein